MSNVLEFKRVGVKSTSEALNEAANHNFESVHIIGYKDGHITFIHSSIKNVSEETGRLLRLCIRLDSDSIKEE